MYLCYTDKKMTGGNVMRADRLLSIILCLQTENMMSAKKLAEKLEVSERTIYRDIDALNYSGFPVYALRGSHGGFALDKHFHIDLSDIPFPEFKNLLLNRAPGPLADLGMNSGRLIHKLMMHLPDRWRTEADQFRNSFYLDPGGWFSRHEAVPFLKMIERAMINHMRIHIDYQKAGGEAISREVMPYGLVAKGDSWYMVAGHADNLRVYRISRICGAELTNKPFCPPSDFYLSRFWRAWCSEFEKSRPSYPVVLRLTREGLRALLAGHDDVSRVKYEDVREQAVFTVRFETFEQALQEILSLGAHAEVLRPAELRQKVCENIMGWIRLYRLKQPMKTDDISE